MRGRGPIRQYRPYPFGWQFRGDDAMAKKVGHHDGLQAYPTDIGEPCRILLSKINGGDVDTACCIHAAYQVTGVALGHLYPDDHPEPKPMTASPALATAPNDEEAKKLLEEATMKRGPITDILLQQLLSFAMKKLQEWLSGR